MAKTPGTPKAKAGAPAQFDMNSRDRKGGKGGPGGPGGPGRGRDRDEKRPPSRVMSMPPATVDRGEGWIIQKIGKIDQASHVAMGAEYHLIFEGHDALVFEFLGAARDRSKEPPPEKVEAAHVEAPEAEMAEAEMAEDGSAEGEAVEGDTAHEPAHAEADTQPVEGEAAEPAPHAGE